MVVPHQSRSPRAGAANITAARYSSTGLHSAGWKTWLFGLLGPTKVHLQHEAYLLVSMALLCLASLQNVYREASGLKGDIIFCALGALWLSRYLFVRWLVLDTSTNASPDIRGVLAHWVTSHVMAGQYLDRPSTQVLAKQGIGAFRAEEDGRAAALSTFILPSFLYTWQFFRIWFWFPLLKFRENIVKGPMKPSSSIKGNSQHSTGGKSSSSHYHQSHKKRGDRDRRLSPSLNKIILFWNKICSALGPTLQIAIPLVPAVYYTWTLAPLTDPLTDLFLPPKTTATDSGIDMDTKAFGSYKHTQRPSWSEVFFYMSVTFTLSVVYFSRLILPIPDLVAGSNVLKAVRNEAKVFGVTGKSSKSKLQKENQDAPWPEQNKSIVNQNRLRLFATVGLLRIIENIYICCFLPWTPYICRATGHCPEGIQLWQLSKILFPAGITTALRSDADVRHDFALNADRLAGLLTFLSVIAISAICFLAQAVTLNGHYLATMGYITGEWTLVDTKKDTAFNNGGGNPSHWDSRRRYKKGDLIVVNRSLLFGGGQVVYKATSNSPEGRPFDTYLRATHDLFRNELGHPSTSKLLSVVIQGHLIFIAFLALLTFTNIILRDSRSNGLVMTLIANLVACYGAINVGLTDHSELQQLNQEIAVC